MTEPSQGHEKPLLVSHITNTKPSIYAVVQDAAEGYGVDPNALAAHLYIREMGSGVLRRLEELHVNDAVILNDRLEALDPEVDVLKADLLAVAEVFAEEGKTATSIQEADQKEQLQTLAQLAGLIAIAQAMLTGSEDQLFSAAQVINHAQSAIAHQRHAIAETTFKALTTLVDELKPAASNGEN